MTVEDLQTIIFQAFENAKTQEGYTIYDKFNPLEVADIINSIISVLPYYPDFIIECINKRVLDVIPPDVKIEVLDREIKSLYKVLYWQKIKKENLLQLITLLLIRYRETFDDKITEGFTEVKDYYYSYPITTTKELVNEIKEVVVSDALSKTYNNYFIRLTKDYNFIPTTTTLLDYTNFLYKPKQ